MDCSLTTNGTLLGDDLLAFLADHDVRLDISFDGVLAAQEVRGAGSFPTLDRLLLGSGSHCFVGPAHEAHEGEHSIEVQLPLLARLAPETAVVGIVIGDGDLDQCQKFAQHLSEFLRTEDPRPLLVISSDLNHYAPVEENRRLDRLAIDAMLSLDPTRLYTAVRDHDIGMCGMLPAAIAPRARRGSHRLAIGATEAAVPINRIVAIAL